MMNTMSGRRCIVADLREVLGCVPTFHILVLDGGVGALAGLLTDNKHKQTMTPTSKETQQISERRNHH